MLFTILKIYFIIGICVIIPVTAFLFVKEKNTPLLNAIILGIINIIKIPIKITYDILDSILALFFNGLACLSKLLIPEEEQYNNNIKIFKEEYKEIKDEKGTKQ